MKSPKRPSKNALILRRLRADTGCGRCSGTGCLPVPCPDHVNPPCSGKTWAANLGACLRDAGALCEAFILGFEELETRKYRLDGGWWPGCGWAPWP
jgi:hypothetical protein